MEFKKPIKFFSTFWLKDCKFDSDTLDLSESDGNWETRAGKENQAERAKYSHKRPSVLTNKVHSELSLYVEETSSPKKNPEPKVQETSNTKNQTQNKTKDPPPKQNVKKEEKKTDPTPPQNKSADKIEDLGFVQRLKVKPEELKVKPFSSVVKLEMAISDDNKYFGSGILVGPSHVLTAAHNVVTEKGGVISDISVFAKLSSEESEGYESCEVVSVHVFSEFIPRFMRNPNQPEPSCDVALLVLSVPLGLSCGWMALGLFSPNSLVELKTGLSQLYVIGYPDETPYQMQYAKGNLNTVDKSTDLDKWKYNLFTSKGQSGSGIILKEGKNFFVVGVHTRGMKECNTGFRFNIEVLKDLVNLIEQTYKVTYEEPEDYSKPVMMKAESIINFRKQQVEIDSLLEEKIQEKERLYHNQVKLEDYEAAIKIANEILSLDGQRYMVYQWIGNNYYRMQNYSKAIKGYVCCCEIIVKSEYKDEIFDIFTLKIFEGFCTGASQDEKNNFLKELLKALFDAVYKWMVASSIDEKSLENFYTKLIEYAEKVNFLAMSDSLFDLFVAITEVYFRKYDLTKKFYDVLNKLCHLTPLIFREGYSKTLNFKPLVDLIEKTAPKNIDLPPYLMKYANHILDYDQNFLSPFVSSVMYISSSAILTRIIELLNFGANAKAKISETVLTFIYKLDQIAPKRMNDNKAYFYISICEMRRAYYGPQDEMQYLDHIISILDRESQKHQQQGCFLGFAYLCNHAKKRETTIGLLMQSIINFFKGFPQQSPTQCLQFLKESLKWAPAIQGIDDYVEPYLKILKNLYARSDYESAQYIYSAFTEICKEMGNVTRRSKWREMTIQNIDDCRIF